MLIISMLRLVLGTFTTLLALAAAAAPDQAGTNALTQPARGSRPGPPISTSTVAAPRRRSPASPCASNSSARPMRCWPGRKRSPRRPSSSWPFPTRPRCSRSCRCTRASPPTSRRSSAVAATRTSLCFPSPAPNADALKIIFHEYTHLLLRHNQPYWPLWLAEGMAEIYSTFEVSGGYHARIGKPIDSTCACWSRRRFCH